MCKITAISHFVSLNIVILHLSINSRFGYVPPKHCTTAIQISNGIKIALGYNGMSSGKFSVVRTCQHEHNWPFVLNKTYLFFHEVNG